MKETYAALGDDGSAFKELRWDMSMDRAYEPSPTIADAIRLAIQRAAQRCGGDLGKIQVDVNSVGIENMDKWLIKTAGDELIDGRSVDELTPMQAIATKRGRKRVMMATIIDTAEGNADLGLEGRMAVSLQGIKQHDLGVWNIFDGGKVVRIVVAVDEQAKDEPLNEQPMAFRQPSIALEQSEVSSGPRQMNVYKGDGIEVLGALPADMGGRLHHGVLFYNQGGWTVYHSMNNEAHGFCAHMISEHLIEGGNLENDRGFMSFEMKEHGPEEFQRLLEGVGLLRGDKVKQVKPVLDDLLVETDGGKRWHYRISQEFQTASLIEYPPGAADFPPPIIQPGVQNVLFRVKLHQGGATVTNSASALVDRCGIRVQVRNESDKPPKYQIDMRPDHPDKPLIVELLTKLGVDENNMEFEPGRFVQRGRMDVPDDSES